MRIRCIILLAAAAVFISVDASAATDWKPMQAGDAPSKRLLRSDTSAEDDDEERMTFSFLTNFVNPLKGGKKSSVVSPKASTNPDITKLNPAVTKQKRIDANKKGLQEARQKLHEDFDNLLVGVSPEKILTSEGFGKWQVKLTAANKEVDTRLTPAKILVSKITDKDMKAMLDSASKNPKTGDNIRKGVFKEWMGSQKSVKAVGDIDESLAASYVSTIKDAIGALETQLVNVIKKQQQLTNGIKKQQQLVNVINQQQQLTNGIKKQQQLANGIKKQQQLANVMKKQQQLANVMKKHTLIQSELKSLKQLLSPSLSPVA